jgi:hypothetical protein
MGAVGLRLGGGDFRVFMVFSIAVAAVTYPALLRLIPQALPCRRVLASLAVFGLGQLENWLWGFQFAWFVVNAGVLWAVAIVTRSELSRWSFPIAVCCCLVASLSSAHGMVAWFCVAYVAWNGRRLGPAVGFLAGGALAALLQDGATQRPSSLWRVIDTAVQLVGCSSKLPAAWLRRDLPFGEWVPRTVGVITVLATLGLVCSAIRASADPDATGLARLRVSADCAGLIAILGYCGGFALLVSVSRADFVGAAAQSRYLTVMSLLLVSVACLGLLSGLPARWCAIGGVVLLGVSSLAGLGSLPGRQTDSRAMERCVKDWVPPGAVRCGVTPWDEMLADEWHELSGR